MEIQRRVIQTKYTTSYFTVWKEIDSQTFKRSNCKKLFLRNVCYCYNLLSCFLFHMVNGRHCFLCKFIDFLRSLQPPYSCGLWNKWFERSLYIIFYLHNKSTMLTQKQKVPKNKVPKWSSHISYLLNFLYFFSFLMLHFFLYKWNVLKNSKVFLFFNTIFFVFTSSLYKARTKSLSTRLHKH